MNEINSKKTLIGSLHKKLNKASVYGSLDLKKLYLLEIINELLFECPTCNNNDTYKHLINLSIELQNSDKDICIYRDIISNYSNIIGCSNCNPNNSSLQVINTKPIISNPDPVRPPEILAPKIEENSKSVNHNIRRYKNYKFNIQDFVTGFTDQYGGTYKNLKIISLPDIGVLTYNGINLIEGYIIDLNLFGELIFTFISSAFNLSIIDSFKYSLSGTSYPDLYSEDITMFININTGNNNGIIT